MEVQGSNFILEEFLGFWSNLRNLPFSEDKLEHIGNIYNASPASACFLVSYKKRPIFFWARFYWQSVWTWKFGPGFRRFSYYLHRLHCYTIYLLTYYSSHFFSSAFYSWFYALLLVSLLATSVKLTNFGALLLSFTCGLFILILLWIKVPGCYLCSV